jgi:hypothetical protein
VRRHRASRFCVLEVQRAVLRRQEPGLDELGLLGGADRGRVAPPGVAGPAGVVAVDPGPVRAAAPAPGR